MRALVEGEFVLTPFAAVAQAALDGAIAGSPELRAIVAEAGDEILGVAVLGPVAGAVHTGRLHLVVVTAAARLRGVARRLCDAAVRAMKEEGARLVVAELADAPGLRPGRELLEGCGWRAEGRVRDYFAKGVDLLLLTRTT